MQRRIVSRLTLAIVVLTAGAARAQEPGARPGWTFVPGFTLTETYDDNITLFGRSPTTPVNDDLVTTYTPRAELAYVGKRMHFDGGYSGSMLDYQTFSMFNRWDQRAQVTLRRSETVRLSWTVNGNLTTRPTTDDLDFDGIPFSHTGATSLNGRAGVTYRLGARDSLSTSVQMQKVSFDRPGALRDYLKGGRAAESLTSYRRSVSARLGVGANYGLRRAAMTGESEAFDFHVVRAVVDYALSQRWALNGGAGLDYVKATATTPSQRAPGVQVAVNHSDGPRRFHLGYQRAFMPSFGFGGSIQSQELGVAYHTPIFGSRRFYTDHSAMLRDSRPLVAAPGLLRLRSLRTTSSVGWAPQTWMQIEGFYSRVQQSSLIPGGAVNRNRVGFLIVTSAPVRVQ